MVIAAECACRTSALPYTLEKVQRQFIDEAALRMLACPVCHAALTALRPEAVLCTGCGRRYPIRDGLPVLLAAAAERL
jgi:uncharacterized protein YbaR (Trm112 family)